MKSLTLLTVSAFSLTAALALAPATASAQAKPFGYRVKVTNLTKGQTFTPLLLATHASNLEFFELGTQATPALETVAETGDTSLLEAELAGAGRAVGDTANGKDLLGPGESATFHLRGGPHTRRLSVIGMLIPTNDTFVAIDNLRLPSGRHAKRSVVALAYDAGTEANDQNCANIPGPRCMGTGPSAPAESDEGHIHVSNGFHDLGSEDAEGNEILGPFVYDWRNPVARVEVTRIR